MQYKNVYRLDSIVVFAVFLAWPVAANAGIDATINEWFRPIAAAMVNFVFYAIPIGEARLPLIVVWLIAGALFFTIHLRLINIRGFRYAIRIVAGKEDPPGTSPGEVTHFQALTTAVSGVFDASEKDRQLGRKLEQELPGILNWAVQDAIKYFENGEQFVIPKSVEADTSEWRREDDKPGTFMRERMVEDGSVTKLTLKLSILRKLGGISWLLSGDLTR